MNEAIQIMARETSNLKISCPTKMFVEQVLAGGVLGGIAFYTFTILFSPFCTPDITEMKYFFGYVQAYAFSSSAGLAGLIAGPFGGLVGIYAIAKLYGMKGSNIKGYFLGILTFGLCEFGSIAIIQTMTGRGISEDDAPYAIGLMLILCTFAATLVFNSMEKTRRDNHIASAPQDMPASENTQALQGLEEKKNG